MRFFASALVAIVLTGCQAEKEPYQWPVPAGFPIPNVPADNPMSAAKVALGKQIFFDKNLSANQTQSCSSCHIQQYAFAEPSDVSVGSTGQPHRRNAQALVNVAYNRTLTWAHDGLVELEQQILIPMFGETPVELGITGHESDVLARFDTEAYHHLFEQAFDDPKPNFDHIVKALASFVRSLISLNSAFDRYAYQGQDEALSDSQIRGLNLFFSEQLECHHCHGGFNFTQSGVHENQLLDLRPFHNTGLYNLDGKGSYPEQDTGLYELSGKAGDMGRFRAPSLRNVAVSGPYMHDGSIETLAEVVAFYAKGGSEKGQHSPLKSVFVRPLVMSEQDKQDLVNFLHSLTDQEFLSNRLNSAPKK